MEVQDSVMQLDFSIPQFKYDIACEKGEFTWDGAGLDSLPNRQKDSFFLFRQKDLVHNYFLGKI